MAFVKSEDLKEYFDRSRRWEQDELRSAIRSKRLAWTVATISSLLAIASVVAVTMLVPLQRIEPFIVRVDTGNGITEAAQLLRDGPVTLDEAQVRYFLAKYITARESYSRATVTDNHRTVVTMSTGNVSDAYNRWISGNNPDSPQTIYGLNGTVRVEIRSIQLNSEGVATVRFVQIAQYEASSREQYNLATVVYEVLPNERLTWQQRLINPIAFAVTEYRVDPEVVQ